MSKSSQGGVQQSREISTELPLNQVQAQVGSVDASRKRNATSTCALLSKKRFRRSSSEINEDLQVLDREFGRQSEDNATVKSEEDSLLSNLYNASPEPGEESPSNAQELSPEPDRFVEELNLPAVTEKVIKLYDGMRMPELIEELPPLPGLQLPEQSNETFTFDYLRNVLGGTAASNGFWVVPSKTRERRLFPHIKSFKVLNSNYDPLLLRRLGCHGAQLSCILAELDDEPFTYPLFIGRGQGSYKYYGTYTEPRYPDRLSGNEMSQIPKYVKEHWAAQIGATPLDGKISKYNETIRAAYPRIPVGWLTDDHKRLIPYKSSVTFLRRNLSLDQLR